MRETDSGNNPAASTVQAAVTEIIDPQRACARMRSERRRPIERLDRDLRAAEALERARLLPPGRQRMKRSRRQAGCEAMPTRSASALQNAASRENSRIAYPVAG